MRQLVLQMQITVDGFVAGPNGENDWVFKTLDDAADAWIVEQVWKAGVHIMGSRTFKDMASYWPSSTEVFAAPMNEIPKAVFTRSGNAATTSKPSKGQCGTASNRAVANRLPRPQSSSHGPTRESPVASSRTRSGA